MPTLALAMIAYNEEAGLPLAIASVKGYVDEVVVAVDSRTTDGTRKAAPGARVFDVPFRDFAQMRTDALRAVKSDWVLMLDADEVLEGDPRPLMNTYALWELPRRHWTDFARRVPAEFDRWYPDFQRRLFPNDPRIHFKRPVHEVAAGLKSRFAEYPILHHFKEALRSEETLAERDALYDTLVQRGLARGFRYRHGKDY
ncbi:MAG: glycosyltransferase family 2 protein [Planctomycetota bacterium]